jgi:aminoglycoside/choline kinase family phosphotransferase
MPLLKERLEHYLGTSSVEAQIEHITPDASTRRYFRFRQDGRSCVACVYPDDLKHAAHNYVDVTRLFRSNGLPVAEIYDFDEVHGIVVVEDLGDRIVRTEIESYSAERKDEVIRGAIQLIARIQSATAAAEDANSIAGRLRFDTEKLLWELNYFKIHYFSTYKKEPLPPDLDSGLDEELHQLSHELESCANVLCHRDFHAANLMLDQHEQLRIIDHQDARIGSPAYDLVSLLLDRVTEAPDEAWLNRMKAYFHDMRIANGLPALDREQFDREFDLQAIQRCLKAAGTFSFQSAVREKRYFIPFIEPTFRIVHSTLEKIGRFPTIRKVLETELSNSL